MPKKSRLRSASPLLPSASTTLASPSRRPSRQRGYSSRWDKASAAFKRKHPLCLGCEAAGRVEATTTTDHVVPHKGNARLMWDEANLQPACTWHHSTVKQALEWRFEAGEIDTPDLRLDSPTALELAARLIAEGRGPGAKG
ncbi:MAG: HNH endonuclease [Kiloniellaceae bacterium]